MKEATGELNSTVIVILSVGVLSTFFFGYLWPLIHHNFQREANCKSATCDCSPEVRDQNDGKCDCVLYDKETGKVIQDGMKCVYKG